MNETEIKILEGDDVTTQSKTPKNTSKKPTPLVHGPTSPEDRLMLEWDGEENELTVNGKYGANPFISITKGGGITFSNLGNPNPIHITAYSEIESLSFTSEHLTIFLTNKKAPETLCLKWFQKKQIAKMADILRCNGVVVQDSLRSRDNKEKLVVTGLNASLEYDGGTTLKLTELIKKRRGEKDEWVPVLSIIDLKTTKLGYWSNYSSLCYGKDEYFHVEYFDRRYLKLLVNRLKEKGIALIRLPQTINELLG